MKIAIGYIAILAIVGAAIFLLRTPAQQINPYAYDDNSQGSTQQTPTPMPTINPNVSPTPDTPLPKETAANPVATLESSLGTIKIELFQKDAPKTVENFTKLAKEGFYNGTKFHRVIPKFMIQGGDPNSKDNDWSNDGMGGPGYTFQDEFNSHKVVRRALAMANSGPNTNGSQFFIVTADAADWLDGKHTVFGKVLEGMDVVDRIEALPTNAKDHPTVDATIINITIGK
jgi:peptidyl-prolyl cis-trans isomerase B (cyclophilin B)